MNIYGDNGTGKPHFDALYLDAFGKDSTDRKDFEIKTLDQYNVVIPKNRSFTVMLVDDVEIIVSRILKEKNWKRGSETTEFSGNVTEYYWMVFQCNKSLSGESK
jgi:hypothetical protein